MIKPTVGRKVWFIPSDYDISMYDYAVLPDPYYPSVNQPLDSTIVAVHSDTLINVSIIDARGELFFTETRLMQDGETILEENESYCMWMPYQVSQAAKDTLAPTAVHPASGTVV
jgi:hypothetical protein